MKSNIEYLREELEGLNTGGLMDMALEWVDGVEKDIAEMKEDVKNAESDQDDLQAELDEARKELNKRHDPLLETENLQEKMALEAFHKFLNRVGAMRAEQILDRLNKEPYLQAAQ